jgi:Domain of unknown function (DUF222)
MTMVTGEDLHDGLRAGPVADALAEFGGLTETLLGLSLDALSSRELAGVLQSFETRCRQLEAVQVRLAAEALHRGVAAEWNQPSTAALLSDLLRISPGEARARQRAALQLGPRRAAIGQSLAPVLEATASAHARGVLSGSHTAVIIKAVAALPPAVRAADGSALEAALAEQAGKLNPAVLARVAQRAVAMLDPDGAQPTDEQHQRHRSLVLSENSDGSGAIRGRLTPAVLAVARAALDPLAKPVTADGGDERAADQRLHDALGDALSRLMKDGGLPDTGGCPTTLLVTIPWSQLRTRSGWARTSHGTLICATEAARLAGDADIIPVFLDQHGGVMSYGRTQRLAQPGQRRVISVRDKGCSFPGCTRPPGWCEIHHLIDWANGGLTNVDSMTMLCAYHHHYFEKTGWECQMINDIPHWIPPSWIDPERQPRRNTAHG